LFKNSKDETKESKLKEDDILKEKNKEIDIFNESIEIKDEE